MDCGDGLACHALTWLVENEYVAATFAKAVADFGISADGAIGQVFFFLKEHIDKIIALGISSFGVYKWWRYREQILHRRLAEYLSESDRRLGEGQAYVLEALQRPGPGQPFKLPLFAEKPLLVVLREQNWDRTPVAANVLSSADWQLSGAMESIERKIQTAERTITSLRQQMATVNILKGAIASAGAKRATDPDSALNTSALFSFKSALQVPGHEQDLVTRELEAHQLRKLRMNSDAIVAYSEVERLAASCSPPRTRELTIARAKLHRAEVMQLQASTALAGGGRIFNGCGAANLLLSPAVPGSALAMRRPFAPFHDWDALDEGDAQYVAAFVAHNLNFVAMRDARLQEALTAYKSILAMKLRFWNRRSSRELRRRATRGVARVEAAQQQPLPIFNVNWLSP